MIELLSALMGRDVSREVSCAFRARAALGSALSKEQQLFVSAHWQEIDAWLSTDAGRETARLVVDEWMASAAAPIRQ